MLTYEKLAEQKKQWPDSVRSTDWIYEVDSDLNCGKKYFLFEGNVQQLFFRSVVLDKYKNFEVVGVRQVSRALDPLTMFSTSG